MTSLRGLDKRLAKRARFERLVLDNNFDSSPVYSPLHIKASAEPTIAGAKGDLYFDSTANALMQHTGSAWEQVGSSPSGNVTIGGTLGVTGAATLSSTLNVTGAATLSSTLDVTGATTIAGALNHKKQVTDTGGAFATPIVLTEAQAGRHILVDDAAGLDFTLPAIAAAQIGTWYKFLVNVTITSNSFRVTAGAGDLLYGGLWMVDFNTAYNAASRDAVWLVPDGVDDLVMTMNGSTTGGKTGTWVEFVAIHATGWFVSGVVGGDGVLATPFS